MITSCPATLPNLSRHSIRDCLLELREPTAAPLLLLLTLALGSTLVRLGILGLGLLWLCIFDLGLLWLALLWLGGLRLGRLLCCSVVVRLGLFSSRSRGFLRLGLLLLRLGLLRWSLLRWSLRCWSLRCWSLLRWCCFGLLLRCRRFLCGLGLLRRRCRGLRRLCWRRLGLIWRHHVLLWRCLGPLWRGGLLNRLGLGQGPLY
mmetsp:Transcript_24883/g.57824  ORF Transcript_24883/g.57824 Transcript_24883/m.57824 type:complete len:203 (-) Transcript_24883:821-1429(-)